MAPDARAPAPAALPSWIVGCLLLLFAAIVLAHLTEPLRSGQRWLVFEQDDFFYYLQIARNLASGHGSTANGIVPTNGYHPLWLLFLAAVCAVSTHGTAIAMALFLVTTLACAATFGLTLRLLHRVGGLRWPASLPLAMAALVYCLKLFFDGMEITLTVPLALAALTAFHNERRWRSGLLPAAGLGLLFSLVILSRLDSALLVAMLLAGSVASPQLRRRIGRRQVLGVALGLLPVVLYLAVNRHVFGVWLPVSGMAKQMRSSHLPALRVWRDLLGPNRLSVTKLLIPLGGLALLAGQRRSVPAVDRVLLLAAAAFPLIHVLVLSIISNWQLWPWYLYSFRISWVALLVLLARLPGVRQLLWRPAAAVGLGTAAVLAAVLARPATAQTSSMLRVAEDLLRFQKQHPPGVYAMGDRAGLLAYLLPEPLVQTEGLTMDRQFLELIRNRTALLAALRQYGVRYYVATVYDAAEDPAHRTDGCFHAVEPWQAGPDSPHMAATLCQPPAARFTDGEFPTLVYDLDSLPAHAAAAPTQSQP